MTTQKQMNANRLNAQQSTGPKSNEGKVIVSSNAIKHGIFTKALILSSTFGKEDDKEYLEMLNNLVDCLTPQNQMESLLVEKIAIDFWRLRRTITFETGSISKHINTMLKSNYTYGTKDNTGIDEEIHYTMEHIAWNISYLECLEKNEVTFDQPIWAGAAIESDIREDFYLITKSLSNLTKEERNRLYEENIALAELAALLKRHGYAQTREISAKLVELYSKENQQLEERIQRLEKQKLCNDSTDSLNCALGLLPPEENTDKVLKYERSLQKSIFQNFFLLKNLQKSS